MTPHGEHHQVRRTTFKEAARIAASFLFLLVPAAGIFAPAVSLEGSLRIGIFTLCALAGGLLLPGENKARLERVLFAILFSAALVWAGSYLQHIRNYPFSISWSEGNHLWGASLFFREGTGIPSGEIPFSTYVTPGLYGLRGLPFLFGRPGIQLYRAWEALLWILPSMLFTWALAAAWTRLDGWKTWIFILWGALFIAQGPVYAPLLLGGAVSILAASDRRPWVQRSGILLGTLIAGLGRWTWMFTPGIWGMLVLRFRSGSGRARARRTWVELGLDGLFVIAGAVLSQVLTSVLTGHALLTYAATLSHPLLWYRLFPNETFPAGILKGAALVTAPLSVGILVAAVRTRWPGRWWTAALTFLFTVGLAAAGLVISVKSGGGSNLHNLDMFLVCLVILAALLTAREMRAFNSTTALILEKMMVMVILLLPIWKIVNEVERLTLPERDHIAEAYSTLEGILQQSQPGEEVLFIDQRQILVFADFPDLYWEPEYEQVEMMDHALAGDAVYFEAFYENLRESRYQWIICDPQPVVFKGRSGPFGEENDAWVSYVTIPLLEHYEVRYAFNDVGVWIMSPVNEDTP